MNETTVAAGRTGESASVGREISPPAPPGHDSYREDTEAGDSGPSRAIKVASERLNADEARDAASVDAKLSAEESSASSAASEPEAAAAGVSNESAQSLKTQIETMEEERERLLKERDSLHREVDEDKKAELTARAAELEQKLKETGEQYTQANALEKIQEQAVGDTEASAVETEVVPQAPVSPEQQTTTQTMEDARTRLAGVQARRKAVSGEGAYGKSRQAELAKEAEAIEGEIAAHPMANSIAAAEAQLASVHGRQESIVGNDPYAEKRRAELAKEAKAIESEIADLEKRESPEQNPEQQTASERSEEGEAASREGSERGSAYELSRALGQQVRDMERELRKLRNERDQLSSETEGKKRQEMSIDAFALERRLEEARREHTEAAALYTLLNTQYESERREQSGRMKSIKGDLKWLAGRKEVTPETAERQADLEARFALLDQRFHKGADEHDRAQFTEDVAELTQEVKALRHQEALNILEGRSGSRMERMSAWTKDKIVKLGEGWKNMTPRQKAMIGVGLLATGLMSGYAGGSAVVVGTKLYQARRIVSAVTMAAGTERILAAKGVGRPYRYAAAGAVAFLVASGEAGEITKSIAGGVMEKLSWVGSSFADAGRGFMSWAGEGVASSARGLADMLDGGAGAGDAMAAGVAEVAPEAAGEAGELASAGVAEAVSTAGEEAADDVAAVGHGEAAGEEAANEGGEVAAASETPAVEEEVSAAPKAEETVEQTEEPEIKTEAVDPEQPPAPPLEFPVEVPEPVNEPAVPETPAVPPPPEAPAVAGGSIDGVSEARLNKGVDFMLKNSIGGTVDGEAWKAIAGGDASTFMANNPGGNAGGGNHRLAAYLKQMADNEPPKMGEKLGDFMKRMVARTVKRSAGLV